MALIGPTVDGPLISVIVPVYNDTARLRCCLECLRTQTVETPFEVIVVDNGSTESIAAVKGDFADVRWLDEQRPGSYNARNTGVAAARAATLAFTDSDCQPDPQWLAQGVAALAGGDGPSFVGGRVELIVTRPTGLFPAEIFDLAVGFPQRRFVEQTHFAMTANMITRRSTFDQVGLFDGSLKSGGDREWGNRAWRHGPGVYADAAVVLHPTRSTPNEVLKRIRRVAGGERDRYPSWGRCLLFCLRHLLPPRRAIRDILAVDAAKAPLGKKARAILFAYRTRLILVGERLSLQLTGAASSRS